MVLINQENSLVTSEAFRQFISKHFTLAGKVGSHCQTFRFATATEWLPRHEPSFQINVWYLKKQL